MNRSDLQRRQPGRLGPRPRQRLPLHCRPAESATEPVRELKRMLREFRLVTVCEEANCPNLNRCFAERTATFMLLGATCTRTCRFCDVDSGRPEAVDLFEPARVAAAAVRMGLRHVVLTSVNRDDLVDGGALQFAATIRALRASAPNITVEVLTPDFQGEVASIDVVLAAEPDVYNHNVETVPRLYRTVRPGARYVRSLELLARVKSRSIKGLIKSGLMLGLGEREDEVRQVLYDLRAVGVDCVTLGQYLRPSLRHLEVNRYLEPAEFDAWAREARELGFRQVSSGPLVRSSFHAGEALELLGGGNDDVAL